MAAGYVNVENLSGKARDARRDELTQKLAIAVEKRSARKVGGEYETYLVVISGPDGKIIDYRSGRSIGEEGIALIRTLEKNTMFDRDGNVLGQLENPGAAFKAAVPAAVAPAGN